MGSGLQVHVRSLPSSPAAENDQPLGQKGLGRDVAGQSGIQADGASAVQFLPAPHLSGERGLRVT